jgi:spermidine/putrescine transport system permease protein
MSRWRTAALATLPTVVVAIAVTPVAAMTVLAFCSSQFPSLPWPGWSLEWFKQVTTHSTLQRSLAESAFVGLSVATLGSFLGALGGYSIARLKSPHTNAHLTLLTVPALTPFLLLGFCFLQFARLLGIGRTTTAVIIAHCVAFSPVVLALVYHRARRLNVDLEDAAREFGASEYRVTLEVVGGQLWPTILAGAVVLFVLSWDEFAIAWFVGGFNKTYPVQVRNMLESTMSPIVSAIGFLVSVFSAALTGAAFMMLRNTTGRQERP